MTTETRILKTSECPSLSGRSTLTYQIGSNEKDEIQISIIGNTGSGIFNKAPVPLKDIESILNTDQPITSGTLTSLLEGKSSNTAGFMLAVLLQEGMLKISEDNARHYEKVEQAEYKKIIQALLETAPEEKAAKKKSGKKREEASK
jgi:hypothetical protein